MYFNGVAPSSGLTLTNNSLLYGSATPTGASAPAGLIYQIATDGTNVAPVYQYGRLGVFTGNTPRSTLLQLSDGFLYGTTSYRSAEAITLFAVGSGTLFKVSADGTTYTKLHDFLDATTTNANSEYINDDGVLPNAPLIQGSDGFLYGMTVYGGANGTGTIYKIRTDGTGFQSIYAFAAMVLKASTDTNGNPVLDANGNPVMVPDRNPDLRIKNATGAHPTHRLTQGTDGYLYGTTTAGGVNGTGTIFKIHPDGSGFALVKTFDASPDDLFAAIRPNATGGYPSSSLLLVNGMLYGATTALGANGSGNVYGITMDGTVFSVLHSFNPGNTTAVGDGATPSGDLIFSNDSMLVGTTSGLFTVTLQTTTEPAVIGAGAIFKVSLDGTTFSNLYVFLGDGLSAATNGVMPMAGVVQAADGSYYGTTSQGGPYTTSYFSGNGTVFKFGEDAHIVTPAGTPEPIDDGGDGTIDIVFGLTLLALLLFVAPWRSLHKRRAMRTAARVR